MSTIVYDLQQLYQRTFGSRPIIPDFNPSSSFKKFSINGTSQDSKVTKKGSILAEDYLGKEIWLPVRFVGLDEKVFGKRDLLLPYTSIEIGMTKAITKTHVAEIRGSVKEQFSIDDYVITLKGFLIDENRIWPEKELMLINELWKLNEAIEFDNVLTNEFLGEAGKGYPLVMIEELRFPAVENGMKHIRPFSMKLVSDDITTLEL